MLYYSRVNLYVDFCSGIDILRNKIKLDLGKVVLCRYVRWDRILVFFILFYFIFSLSWTNERLDEKNQAKPRRNETRPVLETAL